MVPLVTVPLVVVDGANVVGSVPDGWWRDRAGAARRLRDALSTVPGADVRDDLAPDSSGGAHEAAPSGALRGYTDQFEVLKVPRRPGEAK